MIKKEELERKYFIRFLANNMLDIGYTPIEFSDIIKNKKDPPDFIIGTEEHRISFETTLLIHKTGLQTVQFSINSIINKLLKKIDAELPDSFCIKLGQGLGLERFLLNENEVVTQLFEIIKNSKQLPEPEEEFCLTINGERFYAKHYCVDIKAKLGANIGMIFSQINKKKSVGQAAISAFTFLNDFETVKNAISKKESLLMKYKENYKENQLLLVADPRAINGCYFEFDDEFYNSEFETCFDKIYLMVINWDNTQIITELKTKKLSLI